MKSRAILATILVSSLVGCGGSGSTTVSPFSGSYDGNVTLDGGKPGTLNLTVDASGGATGTLTVAAAPTTPFTSGGFTFSLGTHNVTGSIGSDGTIQITGTDSGNGAGDFTIGGTLNPTGDSQITITAGGTSYTGTISVTLSGGGSITFSNGVNTNANLNAFPSNPLIFMSTVGGASSIVVAPPQGGNSRAMLLSLLPGQGAGTTITYVGAVNNVATFSYSEDGTKTWRATSGTATIQARTDNTFSLTFTNVTMTADPETSATGSFVVNGTLSKS